MPNKLEIWSICMILIFTFILTKMNVNINDGIGE